MLRNEDAYSFVNESKAGNIAFTGILPDLNEIDTYILRGEVTTHPKYGEQFAVTSFERIMPKEKDRLVDILSSEMFKGIGRKTALKIQIPFPRYPEWSGQTVPPLSCNRR